MKKHNDSPLLKVVGVTIFLFLFYLKGSAMTQSPGFSVLEWTVGSAIGIAIGALGITWAIRQARAAR